MKKRARRWSFGLGGVVAAALSALPLPLPSASVPVLPLPTPSPPAVIATAPVTATAVPTAKQAAPTASPPPAQTPGPTTPQPVRTPVSGGKERGITIPFTTIAVSSPLDVAVLGALATLPLLFGIWLLLFGRTFTQARRAREARVRLMLAGDLGLRPKELTGISTAALFELREKATFDELTGALRRVAGISLAEREIARARRRKTALSVAFVDVDGLREANERGGRAAGDAALRRLAELLKDGLAEEDVVFRYGGDEFVCVLPETDARAARGRLSEVQADAARQDLRFCFGLAELARSDDVVSLFARADSDLYDFKSRRGEIVPMPSQSEAGKEHTVSA